MDYSCGDLPGVIAAALAARSEVLEAYLFGSNATGRAAPHPDVEVAVCVDRARARAGPFGRRAELTTHLRAVLDTNEVEMPWGSTTRRPCSITGFCAMVCG